MLSASQCDGLKTLYSRISSVDPSQISLPTSCMHYTSMSIKGKIIGTDKSRSRESARVAIDWRTDIFGPPLISIVENYASYPASELLRPTLIEAILLHRPTINGKSCLFALVSVSWFKFHPKMFALGKPLTVWCGDVFEVGGVHSIVPAQMIKCRTVTSNVKLQSETVLCMCPCVDF